jgi:FtsP/CotA-like multicopper oxidase with cupredoxin domain
LASLGAIFEQSKMAWRLTRRSWLQLTGLGSLAGSVLTGHRLAGQTSAQQAHAAPPHHQMHAMGTVGRVASSGLSPVASLRSWNFSELPPEERAKFYRETPRADGTLLREYELFAVDREIEIAPGMFFPAWTYNGQVPGPTIRATEGDRLRITFKNLG